MKKKVKLLPVKEVRTLAEKQRLEINRLENEVLSITGGRDNCKTMMEHYRRKDSEKKTEISYLISQVRTQEGNLSALQTLNSSLHQDLAYFHAETGFQLIGRGIEKLATSVKLEAQNLAARVKYWLGAFNGPDGTGGR